VAAALLVFVAGCSEKKEENKPVPRVADGGGGALKCPVCPDEAGHEQTPAERYAAMKEEVAAAPFRVSVENAWLTGACARGPVPAERRNTSGISAVMRGNVTYTGDDLLVSAAVSGAMVVNVNGKRFAEVPALVSTNGESGSRVAAPVRGADPWVKGQTRSLVFESMPVSEAFCEVVPEEVTLFISLETMGIADGGRKWVLAALPLRWEEVVGMAVDRRVDIRTPSGPQPAKARFSRLSKVLVTRLDGTDTWVERGDVVMEGAFERAAGTSFPVEVVGSEWQLRVKSVSTQKTYKDTSLPGEDEFLAVVEAEIVNTGDADGKAGAIRAALEVEPGRWVPPLAAELGAMEKDAALTAGSSITGVFLFPRGRFERPFRLRLELPEGAPLYLPVFHYDLGPERSPL